MKKMLVLGDSIQWGQGLDEPDKISSLVKAAWAAHDDIEMVRYAHSGSDIWDDQASGALAAMNPRPRPFPQDFSLSAGAMDEPHLARSDADPARREGVGEIPAEEPYTLRQIRDASAQGAQFDLVLVDGGINDTEVYNLVLPEKDRQAVVERARSMHGRIKFMLEQIRDTFAGAKVIVTGYYPVVSDDSNLWQLLALWRKVADAVVEEAQAEAKRLKELVTSQQMLAKSDRVMDLRWSHPLASFTHGLAQRCDDWTKTVHAVIEDAIKAVDPGGTRMRFADPGFGPTNAIFASESLLAPFDNGAAQDRKAGWRHDYCKRNGITGFRRLEIECASMGHPSEAGAKQYAGVVVDRARDLGLF